MYLEAERAERSGATGEPWEGEAAEAAPARVGVNVHGAEAVGNVHGEELEDTDLH